MSNKDHSVGDNNNMAGMVQTNGDRGYKPFREPSNQGKTRIIEDDGLEYEFHPWFGVMRIPSRPIVMLMVFGCFVVGLWLLAVPPG